MIPSKEKVLICNALLRHEQSHDQMPRIISISVDLIETMLNEIGVNGVPITAIVPVIVAQKNWPKLTILTAA